MAFVNEEICSFFVGMKLPTKTFQAKKLATKKNGKAYIYTPPDLIAVMNYLTTQIFHYVKPYMPKTPYTKIGIIMDIYYCFNAAKAKKEVGELYIKKPDRDNLTKGIQDIFEKIDFVKDDSIIASGIIKKSYEKHEGIFFRISKQVKVK